MSRRMRAESPGLSLSARGLRLVDRQAHHDHFANDREVALTVICETIGARSRVVFAELQELGLNRGGKRKLRTSGLK
jgi:hypothetical protein